MSPPRETGSTSLLLNAWPSSTTTARCGAKSRCRSSRFVSGAASAGGRFSLSATRTATFHCYSSRADSIGPALRLLLMHDDATRAFEYVADAEKSLELARSQHWTTVSIRNDWAQVFE